MNFRGVSLWSVTVECHCGAGNELVGLSDSLLLGRAAAISVRVASFIASSLDTPIADE